MSPETEIRYWRLKSGEEVDFVWIKNQRPYPPIEVKTLIGTGDIPFGLKAFINRYPSIQKAFIVNKHTEGEVFVNKTLVSYIKWENVKNIPEMIE
jgi:hypothetical protein